jgi:hypothetical protein
MTQPPRSDLRIVDLSPRSRMPLWGAVRDVRAWRRNKSLSVHVYPPSLCAGAGAPGGGVGVRT